MFKDDRVAYAVRLGRYPGPVWSLMAVVGIGLVNLAVNLVVPDLDGGTYHLPLYLMSGFLVFVLMLLAVAGPYLNSWALIVVAGLLVVATCLLISVTPLHVEIVSVSFAFIALTLYVSYWYSRVALPFVVTTLLLYSFVLFASGNLVGMFAPWFIIVSSCLMGGLGLSVLVTRLRESAMVDQLTGLLNRTGLNSLISLHPGGGRLVLPRTLLIVDLDGFKQVNDVEGHLAGDKLLRELSVAWRATLRPDDIAVRMGGDEFAFILPQTSLESSKLIVERLRLAHPAAWSCGAADWLADESFDEAMSRADAALYEEKELRKSGLLSRELF